MTAAATPSAFVPAAPVWALVLRKQAAWGYADDEMAAWLGLGACVDARGWMLRTTAERILRRLATPAPATAGTRAAWHRQRLVEATTPKPADSPDERRRIAAELAGAVDDLVDEVPQARVAS